MRMVLKAILIMLMVCPFSKAQDSALKRFDLKGPVKSLFVTMTHSTTESSGESQEPKINQTVSTNFDQLGRVTEEVIFEGNGHLLRRTTHAYGNDGTEFQASSGTNDFALEKRIFKRKLDSAGRDVETLILKEDGTLRERMTRSYDARGRVEDGSTYEADGTLSNRTVTKYDESGKVSEMTLFNGRGAIIFRSIPYEVTLYDEETNAIRQRTKRTKPVLNKPDQYGNWTVATSEVTTERAGQIEHYVEIHKRVITYY